MNTAQRTPLKAFIRENIYFLMSFLLLVLIAGLLLITTRQGDAIFFFSENRSREGDLFFRYTTRLGEPVAYFIAIFILLFHRYRYVIVIPILGLSVSVVSFLSKTLFSHDRPYLYFRKLGIFDQINPVDGIVLYGGSNSFPSGHSMSAFALFAFLAFCLPRKKGTAILLFLLAVMVAISRIYLVQHFLQDVYLGAFMGVSIALFWYALQSRWTDQPQHWLNRSLKRRLKSRALAGETNPSPVMKE